MEPWKLADVLRALNIPVVKVVAGRSYYRCPRHTPDKNPSLEISAQGWLCGPCGKKGVNGWNLLAFCLGIDPQEKDLIKQEAAKIGLRNGKTDDSVPRKESPRDVIQWYEYRNASGQIVYRKARRRNKEFSFFNVDQNVWERGGPPLLYNLPAIIGQKTIFFCEGEKDSDNLIRLGFPATTTDSGGGKNYESQHLNHAIWLRGKRIYLFYDNDESGREYAQSVARLNFQAADGVFVVELPDLGPGEDVSDFISRFETPAEAKKALQQLIDATEPWVPAAEDLARIQTTKEDLWERDVDLFELEELSLFKHSDNFVNLYRGRIYWSSKHDIYYLWNGKVFVVTPQDRLLPCVAEIIPQLFDMRVAVTNRDLQKKISKAIKSTGLRLLNDILRMSKSKIEVMDDDLFFDMRPRLVNFDNGTLDLETGAFRPHLRGDLLTRILPYGYDPDAESPTMTRHLLFTQPREEIRDFLQELCGMCMTGDTSVQRIFMFEGPGGNGKTVFVDGVSAALGGYESGQYVKKVPADLLLSGADHDRSMQMKAELRGVRLVVASEMSERRPLNEALVKEITGEQTLVARHLRGQHFNFRRQFKTIAVLNEKPSVLSNTDAIWRRITIVPWEIQIPPNRVDDYFLEKLTLERAGIMNWLIEGAKRYIASRTLTLPVQIVDQIKEYRSAQDTLRQALDECCEAGDFEATDSVYPVLIWWAKRGGFRQLAAISKTRLTQDLKARGIESEVRWAGGKSKRVYIGIQLRADVLDQYEKEMIPQSRMF